MTARDRAFILWALVASLCGIGGGVLLGLLSANFSPLLAFFAICGLLGVTAILLFPVLGFVLAAFIVPMERLGRFTNDSATVTISLMRFIGLLALGSFLLHAIIEKRKLSFGAAFFLYLAYWGVCVLTVFFTSDVIGALKNSSTVLGNLLFFFMIINVVRNWDVAKIAVLVWLVASVLIGVYTIYDWHWGQAIDQKKLGDTGTRFSMVWIADSELESVGEVRRAMGPTSNAAVYGINLIMTLPFLAYLFRESRSWMKVIVFLSTAVISYNLLLTNTRAVLLIALLTVLLCVIRRLFVMTPARIITGLIGVVVVLLIIPDAVYQRVFTWSNYSYEHSATLRARLDYWQAGLRVVEENWFIGAGVGNGEVLQKYVKTSTTGPIAAHNEYLGTLVEVGVVGWLLFFGFVGLLLWYSFKAGAVFRRFRQTQEQYWFMVACQVAMISVLLFGVQVDVFHFPLKGWWLIAGLTWVMYQLAQQVTTAAKETESEGVSIR